VALQEPFTLEDGREIARTQVFQCQKEDTVVVSSTNERVRRKGKGRISHDQKRGSWCRNESACLFPKIKREHAREKYRQDLAHDGENESLRNYSCRGKTASKEGGKELVDRVIGRRRAP